MLFFLSYGPAKVPPAQTASSSDNRGVTNARDTGAGICIWRCCVSIAVSTDLLHTLDCVSAPLVDKMLVCLPRMGFPDAERQSILSFRDRASGKLSLHDTDGMWVSNMYVIHFGS